MEQIVINQELCDACGTCVGVCPEDAIELSEFRITIDHEKCTRCLSCVNSCPLGLPEVSE